jgi:uncharacterized protein (DUF433 family)
LPPPLQGVFHLPQLRYLPAGEAEDIHPTNREASPGRGSAIQLSCLAKVRARRRPADGHAVILRDQVMRRDGEIRKGSVGLGDESQQALAAGRHVRPANGRAPMHHVPEQTLRASSVRYMWYRRKRVLSEVRRLGRGRFHECHSGPKPGSFGAALRWAGRVPLRENGARLSIPAGTVSSSGDVQTEYPHIVRRPDVLGGTPVIAGTRLPVWQVVAACNRGISVDELVDTYPNLTRAAAHSALAYYWDHQEEIDAEIQENQPAHVLHALRSDPRWLEERPGVFRLRTPFGPSPR